MIFYFEPNEQGIQKVMAIAQSLGPSKHGYIGEFKKNHPVRSTRHNSWYWVGTVKVICNYTGEDDKDRIHNFLQLLCNYEEQNLKDGRTIRVPLGTHWMNEQQFSEYCRKAREAAQREFPGLIFVDERKFNKYVEEAIEDEFKRTFNR